MRKATETGPTASGQDERSLAMSQGWHATGGGHEHWQLHAGAPGSKLDAAPASLAPYSTAADAAGCTVTTPDFSAAKKATTNAANTAAEGDTLIYDAKDQNVGGRKT